MFCNGDLDPDTKRAACRGRGIKPPNFVKPQAIIKIKIIYYIGFQLT
jgi:hypothetical protein